MKWPFGSGPFPLECPSGLKAEEGEKERGRGKAVRYPVIPLALFTE